MYENEVLETKLTEILNSKLEVHSLMTVDDSLTESAGLTKVINRYTYNGMVQELESGESNSVTGFLTFKPETYTVKRYQQTFRYNDMDAMKDPALVDMALEGAADVMSNQLRKEYFDQLKLIGNRHSISGASVTYTDIVDALSELNHEVEDGLFILMGAQGRAAIRKDPDFIASHQGEIVYDGQFGTLCGIPVLFTKLIQDNKVIITERAAVKFFVKKEASLEQSRNIETKDNTIVYERHGVCALVDDTSSIIIGTGAPELVFETHLSSGMLTITDLQKTNNYTSIVYALDVDAPLLGEQIINWMSWDETSPIEIESAKKIAFAEVQGDMTVVSSTLVRIE